MECEYCHKKYSSLSSLNNHKKTNKKCILNCREETSSATFVKMSCNFCEKQFMCRKTLRVHLNGFCKVKKEEDAEIRKKEIEAEFQKEIVELKKQLKKKDDDLKELALKAISEPRTVVNNHHNTNTTTTTTTNNNNITTTTNNNTKYEFVVPFTPTVDDFRENIKDNYTKDHFLQGQRGLAYFARDYLLMDRESGKLMYYCSDTGRKKFIMKNKKGKIVKDCKSVKLTGMMMSGGIGPKSKSIYRELLSELDEKQKGDDAEESYVSYDRKRMACVKNLNEIEELETNNDKFVTVLSTLVCNPCGGGESEEDNNNNNNVMYEIEIDDDDEEEEEEEDISQYTDEYFLDQEAKIEKYRETAMYRGLRKRFEEEKAWVMMLRNPVQ
jgi:hypothetical protein